MAYSAVQIAEWIRMEADRQRFSVDPLKIQKLLYYVQGFSLGMSGEALFDEPIEAWTHGPVVRSVYDAYKRFGSNAIPPSEPEELPPEDVRFLLMTVVKEKGPYSAWDLRELTHKELPWKNTPRSHEIPVEDIKEFFSDRFWEPDEEDEYQPTFDTPEEERAYCLSCFTQEELDAVHRTR